MFRESSFHTIDPKNRIIIPTRFRETLKSRLSQDLIITRLVAERGLAAYPLDVWQKIEERFSALTELTPSMQRIRRLFLGMAKHCQPDGQGRLLVPQPLKEFAQLEKDILLVGVLNHFEIWSKENWDGQNAKFDEDLQKEEVVNEIAKLGL